VDWLIVGLGNPGREHADTRHNVGFMVADRLAESWGLARAKDRFRGRLAEGRVPAAGLEGGIFEGPGGGGVSGGALGSSVFGEPQGGGFSREVLASAPAKAASRRARARQCVAVLWPQTYMNDVGCSVGPARGAFKLPLERVLVVHDEIDLPFDDVRTRLGGGLAGHNGLKSIKRELGSANFMRVRVGVGRPKSTDPEIVSSYVLGRFRESATEVSDLIDRACEAVERVVLDEGE
jgi:PTH1 family peptidyl-tRNA hydrolase